MKTIKSNLLVINIIMTKQIDLMITCLQKIMNSVKILFKFKWNLSNKNQKIITINKFLLLRKIFSKSNQIHQ
jgi:hypothetical protein